MSKIFVSLSTDRSVKEIKADIKKAEKEIKQLEKNIENLQAELEETEQAKVSGKFSGYTKTLPYFKLSVAMKGTSFCVASFFDTKDASAPSKKKISQLKLISLLNEEYPPKVHNPLMSHLSENSDYFKRGFIVHDGGGVPYQSKIEYWEKILKRIGFKQIK